MCSFMAEISGSFACLIIIAVCKFYIAIFVMVRV